MSEKKKNKAGQKLSFFRAVDDRGTFSNMECPFDIKRSYIIKNTNAGIIRGFHGHSKEEKFVFCVQGRAKILTMPVDAPNLENIKSFGIAGDSTDGIYIPAGNYNGFMSLSEDAIIVVLSSMTMKESVEQDDFRLPWDYHGAEVWEVKNR